MIASFLENQSSRVEVPRAERIISA